MNNGVCCILSIFFALTSKAELAISVNLPNALVKNPNFADVSITGIWDSRGNLITAPDSFYCNKSNVKDRIKGKTNETGQCLSIQELNPWFSSNVEAEQRHN